MIVLGIYQDSNPVVWAAYQCSAVVGFEIYDLFKILIVMIIISLSYVLLYKLYEKTIIYLNTYTHTFISSTLFF